MSLVTAAVNVFLRLPLYRLLRRRRQLREFHRWDRSGRAAPPPHLVKQQVIRRYAQQHGCDVLVETGTYRGDMLLAMLSVFRRLYSIELHPVLHQRACRLFRGRSQVRLLQGDSGQRIPDVLQELDRPALFWLDGHYSAGNTAKAGLNTPVVEELNHILAHPVRDHVILIDDARLFNGTDDYPTIDNIREQVIPFGAFDVQVEHDVIAITRRAA